MPVTTAAHPCPTRGATNAGHIQLQVVHTLHYTQIMTTGEAAAAAITKMAANNASHYAYTTSLAYPQPKATSPELSIRGCLRIVQVSGIVQGLGALYGGSHRRIPQHLLPTGSSEWQRMQPSVLRARSVCYLALTDLIDRPASHTQSTVTACCTVMCAQPCMHGLNLSS